MNFFAFIDLKRMEIGGNRMGGAVNALICLTALKLLVQLDFIGIYGLNDSGRVRNQKSKIN